MRPLRLELQGFTSFREATVIDFTGAEYFALVGPTGSGKSTIIDAMSFALYGSVFRLEDRRKVAPVISQGKLEAKVRFDFAIGDDTFTAVRVVRRVGTGASTKEARLEKGDEVLAGTADELTAVVTELLGLSFDHFTRCVVLPQGEFARFLHDPPKERQKLLIELLNLGVYGQMMQAANARAARIKNRIGLVEERLAGELAAATPEALTEAKGRAKRLATLRREVDEALPRLVEHTTVAEAAATREAEARTWIARIDELAVPRGVERLAKDLAAAQKTVTEARSSVEAAAKTRKALEAKTKELPKRTVLSDALKAYERRAALQLKIASASEKVAAAEGDEAAARKVFEDANTAFVAAEEDVDELRRSHDAFHLAEHLEPGEPCPVCHQAVTTLPKHSKPKAIHAAEKKVDKARAALAKEQIAVDAAARKVAEATASSKAITDQLADVESELAEALPEAQATKALQGVDALEAQLEDARETEDAARDSLREAEERIEHLRAEERDARAEFEQARDLFGPLGPPGAQREDLAADWKDLMKWAALQRSTQTKAAALAAKEAAVAVAARDALLDALRRSCAECQIEVVGDDFVATVVAAHTEANGAVKELERNIAEATKLRAEIQDRQVEHDVAHALAQHLSARSGFFENWIVNEALRRLVVGAGAILRDLSNDRYALDIDDAGNFQVIDRDNADETRSARTLSGGETFLASLALALALADQLAQLASEGAARLEAIFLDEGFGTLDPETLGTVAATVENLAATGRMVGIVTHVRDLAEQVPLRFVVRKDGRTSTVDRTPA